ncbi:MAG: hypothetical protein KKG35_06660, partial [Proteobacteria bacterium]|nr:hypothetical protein [Pseudomonadota bacterium]
RLSVRADKLLNSAFHPSGISLDVSQARLSVRADKLLNSAFHPSGISFVRADKLLNSALSFSPGF